MLGGALHGKISAWQLEHLAETKAYSAVHVVDPATPTAVARQRAFGFGVRLPSMLLAIQRGNVRQHSGLLAHIAELRQQDSASLDTLTVAELRTVREALLDAVSFPGKATDESVAFILPNEREPISAFVAQSEAWQRYLTQQHGVAFHQLRAEALPPPQKAPLAVAGALHLYAIQPGMSWLRRPAHSVWANLHTLLRCDQDDLAIVAQYNPLTLEDAAAAELSCVPIESSAGARIVRLPTSATGLSTEITLDSQYWRTIEYKGEHPRAKRVPVTVVRCERSDC